MTDEEYLFRRDIADKKATARSAARRVSGAKSKKCTLPSDYLSAAQKKKLNGEVRTVNMNQPMKWEEFKALEPDTQTLYVSGLAHKYGITIGALAGMLGVSRTTAYNYSRAAWGLQRRMTQADREAFRAFCDLEQENGENPTSEAATGKAEPPNYYPATVERMMLTLRGTVYFCTEYLRALPLGDGEYTVKIEITKENGNES